MTFIVNGIKEGFNKKYNIEFLLWVNSVLLAKKIMEDVGIIVLSMKEYKEANEMFGNLYFKINYQQQDITIVSKFDGTLSQACNFFLTTWFKLIDINTFQNPETNENSQKIIADTIREVQEQQKEQKIIIQQKQEAEKKIYDDERLWIDKKAIEWILNKIEEVKVLAQGYISWKDLKILKERAEELKKLKLWTNHERIKDLMEEVTTTIENLENNFYDEKKDEETNILSDSLVTNRDVIQELHKLEKIKKLKEIGGKIKTNEQDYLVFNKGKIIQKFLTKDIFYFFSTQTYLTNMIYNTYDLIEIGIMIVLIGINIYIPYNIIFWLWSETSHTYIYQKDISIWLLWLILYWVKYFRTKNIARLIALVPVIIILYYSILRIIQNNLAL